MAKFYVNRGLKNGDAAEIERIVRDCAPFIVTPSNIEDGQEYDVELLRKESCNTGVELKALLDNNIFTRIIPLINGEQDGKLLDYSQRKACAIMCFLIYAGIEADPAVALWERTISNVSSDVKKDDFNFRIADHLHPQVFADLALKRTNAVDGSIIKDTIFTVANNQITMRNLQMSDYSNVPEEHYNLIYMGLLKYWVIYQTETNKDKCIIQLIDWMYDKSISFFEVISFALKQFDRNRSGGIFKKINSGDCNKVFKNAKNAAWDIFYIFVLNTMHINTDSKTIYFFASMDKNLLKLPRTAFDLYNNNQHLEDLLNSKYPGFGFEEFMKSMGRFNTRPMREQYISKLMNSLDNSIEELENQVRDMLS